MASTVQITAPLNTSPVGLELPRRSTLGLKPSQSHQPKGGFTEEPLRSDVDVKGLKAQFLGRIEELEAREGGDAGRACASDGGPRARHGSHESDDERISLFPASLCGGTRNGVVR
jgi:hypothetical protein